MDAVLDEVGVRILGCLIEKEMTTPEYYPLSVNALISACNQKSNRHPVVSYDEETVEERLEVLRQRGLAGRIQAPGSRVAKYLHAMTDRFDLSRQELAVFCELMLRGPQTVGELRSRAERMCPMGSHEDVEGTLTVLVNHDPPLVEKLPRDPGRKECRYAHLLLGGVGAGGTVAEAPGEAPSPERPLGRRLEVIEEEIAALRGEVEALKARMAGQEKML